MTFEAGCAILKSMIIATRRLTIDTGTDQHALEIRIYAPVATDVDFCCSYEIDWPGRVEKTAMFGLDSAQALILEFNAIGSTLYSSEYHENGQLSWNDEASGYGFPVVPTLRQMLVGDDARFF